MSQSFDRAAGLRLAAYSFLILYFELAFIRYLPANVKVFSFYSNFVLIAAFVGMGTGLLAVRQSGRPGGKPPRPSAWLCRKERETGLEPATLSLEG